MRPPETRLFSVVCLEGANTGDIDFRTVAVLAKN